MTKNNEVITAFTEEQVAQLTGISIGQLRYWDKTEFFQPEFGWSERSVVYSRIYSYLDVVSLRVISRLRKHVPLQRLRVVKEKLAEHNPDIWRSLTLWVDGKEVAFLHPNSKKPEQVVTGQKIMQLPMADAMDDLEAKVESLFKRSKDLSGQIDQHRLVMRNKPVVAGTRIPVSAIKAFHEAGYSAAEIVAEYPTLTFDDVKAVLVGAKVA